MMWRLFGRRSSAEPDASAWWSAADDAALVPGADAIARLRETVTPLATSPDEHERQLEMIAGLEQLASLADDSTLPMVTTQHRVIGHDTCHFLAPAGRPDHPDAAGKIFVTSTRLVFVSGAPIAWPWHRISNVVRRDRDVMIQISGQDEPLMMRCNSYGDALALCHVAARVRGGP